MCDQNIAVETLGRACLRGAATGRVDAGQRAAATDSEEAAAAAPRGDGLGGSGSSGTQGRRTRWKRLVGNRCFVAGPGKSVVVRRSGGAQDEIEQESMRVLQALFFEGPPIQWMQLLRHSV